MHLCNFTFIIPHKNIPSLLQRCIDSIPQREDVHIVVVDDNSDSCQVDFSHFPGLNNPFVEVIFTKEGYGAGYARNVGLKQVQSKWVLFADADDYLPDVDIFRKYISMAEQTGADIVVSNYARLWENRVLPAVKHETFALCSPYSEEFRFRGFFSVGTLSYVWGKFYRSEFLKKYQIIFGNISYAEDKLFNMECYICDAKYVFLEDTGYIYRKNDTSVSWQYRPDSTQNWFKLANELKGWIEKKNKDPNKYASLTRYLIFFAVFFDAKMEYMQHKKSIWAIRKVLKKYGTNPSVNCRTERENCSWMRECGKL